MFKAERNSTTPICNVDMNVLFISLLTFPSTVEVAIAGAFCFAFGYSTLEVGAVYNSSFCWQLVFPKIKTRLTNILYCFYIVVS